MDVLQKILNAREQRHNMRLKFSQEGLASISLSLNISGHPKSDSTTSKFFQHVLRDLKIHLAAHRLSIVENKEQNSVDSDGNFYLVPLVKASKTDEEIKEICEKFEKGHLLGRMIDVDLTSNKGIAVSSGKSKKCFVCEEHPAIVCMREQRHSLAETRNFLFQSIKAYLEKKKAEEVCRKLSSFALRSLLYEISLTPKPGLVDTKDSGVHTDMNYYTFLNSTSAISHYFVQLANKGYYFEDNDYKAVLPMIRDIGLRMESDMFSGTLGINTQKGIIFLMGLSLFIAAYTIRRKKKFDAGFFRNSLIRTCSQLDGELNEKVSPETHGEKCSSEYGYQIGGGARAEAQAGFPTVFNVGLIGMQNFTIDLVANKEATEQILKNTLMAIIAETNDSNVLYRSSLELLNQLKFIAAKSLKEDTGKDKEKIYQQLISFCQENNVSPGGSADLLAVTVFIHFVSMDFAEPIDQYELS